jgi:hypothetical protein
MAEMDMTRLGTWERIMLRRIYGARNMQNMNLSGIEGAI